MQEYLQASRRPLRMKPRFCVRIQEVLPVQVVPCSYTSAQLQQWCHGPAQQQWAQPLSTSPRSGCSECAVHMQQVRMLAHSRESSDNPTSRCSKPAVRQAAHNRAAGAAAHTSKQPAATPFTAAITQQYVHQADCDSCSGCHICLRTCALDLRSSAARPPAPYLGVPRNSAMMRGGGAWVWALAGVPAGRVPGSRVGGGCAVGEALPRFDVVR